MRAEDLQAVLLVRAVEEGDREGTLLPPAERAAASREARREHRSSNELEVLLPARARRLLKRLIAQHPAVATALSLSRGLPWLGAALIVGSLAAGFALSALDGTRSINILGFPVLGLVLWNLAVYAGLLARSTISGSALVPFALRLARPRGSKGTLHEALKRFFSDWYEAARALYLARAAQVLHLAALALALGLIGGLYLRGLALDYQAVWASTFLDAREVHGLVSVVYGPASLATGVPIPGIAELEAIRSRGESAARWIHLMAGTVALFVVIPRALLAAAATVGAARKRRDLVAPSSLHAYFRSAFAQDAGFGRTKIILAPYAYEPSPPAAERLHKILPDIVGGILEVEPQAPTPYGEEDALLAKLELHGAAGAHVLAILFSLAATPEDENHGTLIGGARELLARHQPHGELMVLVDEAPYAARLAGAGGERLAERRALWQAFARARGAEARFIDLATPAA